MTQSRILENMTVNDLAIAMSEGNPGALSVICDLIQKKTVGMVAVFALDALRIYGSTIFLIWKYVCNEDLDKYIRVILATSQGKI